MHKKIWVVVTVITLMMLGAFAWLKLPLWRNTIIRSVGGGTFVTASGKEFPTNRWFSRTKEFAFTHLHAREGGVVNHYLIEHHEESEKAKVRFGSSDYYAILDDYTFKSEGKIIDYTVRPGSKAE